MREAAFSTIRSKTKNGCPFDQDNRKALQRIEKQRSNGMDPSGK